MNKFLTIVLLFASLTLSAQTPDVQGYVIYKGDTIDLKGTIRVKPEPPKTGKIIKLPVSNNSINVNVASTLKPQPGDVLLIPAGGSFNSIRLSNFSGTPDKPIYIRQEDPGPRKEGYTALVITNAKHFVLDGVHTDGKGVNKGIGMMITTGCSDFQILNCSSVGAAIGLQIKTNPGTAADQRWPTEIRNVVIRNFAARDCGAEGVYIGYSGGTSVPAGVVPVPVTNLVMENITVENTGWDGIQITGGINLSGKNFVVKNFGKAKVGGQNTAIALQTNTSGELDGFTVENGNGGGLIIFGRENLTIKNGTIKNVGVDNPVGDAIYVSDYPSNYNQGPLSLRLQNITVDGYTRFPINMQNKNGTLQPGIIENFIYTNGGPIKYKINNAAKSQIIGGTEGK